MKTVIRRARAILIAAALAAPVMGVVNAGAAAALTCTSADSATDPATTVSVTPANATREVDDEHTVTVHAECNGQAAAGDPIKIQVEGPNAQTRKDLLDEDGNLTWTYEGYSGDEGVDHITACTDTYDPQACGSANATWVSGDDGWF